MKWIFVALFLAMISICNAMALDETVQNHWDMDGDGFGDKDDLANYWNIAISGQPLSSSQIYSPSITGFPYTQSIHYKSAGGYLNCTVKSESSYWSFMFTGSIDKYPFTCLRFYNRKHELIQEYTGLQSYSSIHDRYELYELLIYEGTVYMIKNGTPMATIGSCSETPAYISFYCLSSGVYEGGWIDDVTTNDGIVGIGAEPCLVGGFVNRTIIEATNHELDVSWHVKTLPIADYTNSQYDLKVKRATWGDWYNITQLKAIGNTQIDTKPAGNIKYNWSELFNTDHYGLYWFTLYKTSEGEPESIGQDWLYFKDAGEPSTINIEETEYAIGETMNISYYIDSPDFGANQYKIQIFDSTGQLKDERVLNMQAATEQITSTIDWEEGMLYAVLVKDTKPAITEDPPEDIKDLAYDFCTLSNVIYITGKVYDASNSDMIVDGTLLANVSLNWTQAGTIYNTTSDSYGNYEFIDATTLFEVEWFQDTPITVHAEKTGYSHSDFDMVIIKAGRYTVDIYMTPPVLAGDLENASVAGLVADDIFHQCIPFSYVEIWNSTWSNHTYTNAWGWYEFTNISNGTYNMRASKDTYRTKLELGVEVGQMSVQLEACDVADYNEATLDECDSITGWSSSNTLTLDTVDYIEATGALNSTGTATKDFEKTFSPGVDSDITGAHGYFYLYAKVDNKTNISSSGITITISSNATGATDKIVWVPPKNNFNTTWDLHVLKIENGTETGICNLSNITYFKLESTKSGIVETKIDFLAFVEYAGWESCVDISIDSVDTQEGTGSLKAVGTPKTDCELVAGRWWSAPFDASVIDSDSELARLQFWNKEDNSFTTQHADDIYLEDSDGDYLFWENVQIYSNNTWQERELFLSDASETGTFNIGKITWLGFYHLAPYSMMAWFDDIRLVQAGQTRQNFFLSQNYNLTVYAKDMDTRFTITSFTAILDSTRVAETTTAGIVFNNVTYGIYPLEVSANGYYTNKQYVFVGQDTTQTVYLTKIENVSGGGAGMYFPPRSVEFKVQTLWGEPVEGVTVNATALETSGSSWSWLWKIMGATEDIAAEIENGSMNGTTDTMGKISFMMIETVKYTITFTKPSESVNKSITVYPKDDHYLIIVGTKTFIRDSEWYENVNFTVGWSEINNTHGYINMSYNDTSMETLSLTLYVNNTDDIQSIVWSQYYSGTCNQTNAQVIVDKTDGKSFYVGFIADHITFGHSPLEWNQVLKFQWFLDLGIPHSMCLHLSIAFLVFFACFFGATTAEVGAVFVSMFAWIFHFIGWLEVIDGPTTIFVLTLITALAVLSYLTVRSRRVYHY